MQKIYQNRTKSVQNTAKISFTLQAKKAMAFTSPILTKLAVAERHCVQIVHITFRENGNETR
jgi:hypothetical protein